MNDKVEYTIFDALEHIGKRIRLVIFLPLAAGIIAVAIGFVMPKWYRAESEVLPQYSPGGGVGALSGIVGGIIGLGGEGSFNLRFAQAKKSACT